MLVQPGDLDILFDIIQKPHPDRIGEPVFHVELQVQSAHLEHRTKHGVEGGETDIADRVGHARLQHGLHHVHRRE